MRYPQFCDILLINRITYFRQIIELTMFHTHNELKKAGRNHVDIPY